MHHIIHVRRFDGMSTFVADTSKYRQDVDENQQQPSGCIQPVQEYVHAISWIQVPLKDEAHTTSYATIFPVYAIGYTTAVASALLHIVVLHLCGHDVGNILLRELLEDGCLAGVVQAQHQDTSLLVASLQLTQQRQETHPADQSAVLTNLTLPSPSLN